MHRLMMIVLMLLVCAVSALAQDEAQPAAGLEITEMAFGVDYDGETRTLVGESSTFAAGTSVVYCRTRVLGDDEPTNVTHVWYRDGKTQAHVELTVGSSNWRTYSSKKLQPDWTGAWEVRVLDSAGNLLRSEHFTVE